MPGGGKIIVLQDPVVRFKVKQLHVFNISVLFFVPFLLTTENYKWKKAERKIQRKCI